MAELLRRLPPVQRLLEGAEPLCAAHGRTAVTDALRIVLERLRREIQDGAASDVPEDGALIAAAAGALAARARPGLRRVINATGIVLHTNLGRAPLAAEAVAAVASVASGYCTLEFDLSGGVRGSRTAAVERLLCALTGAEAATVVNNGAAAILLALAGLAAEAEVIVSRGELIEIGGGFRVPDVIRQGGARLVEVGATNKTRAEDYRAAIGPATRVLLKVHQSNFRMVGFTAETGIAALSALARAHGLLVVADVGSGLLARAPWVAEPTLRQALADGADLVTCSGDKLLGGPQAGLLLGTRAAVERVRRHPLMRALRLDKMSLAALEATLMLHRDRPELVPVQRMLSQTVETLAARAARVGIGEVVATEAFAGGGSVPEERIESRAVALTAPDGAEALAARLRAQPMPVIGRIAGDRVLLDMLAVADEEVPALAAAIQAASA